MAKRGRPRKPGKRTDSDRLARGALSYDSGSDRARAKFSVYGADGSDAIGRAYVEGLLGEDALNLRNVARSIFRAYWPMLAVGREKCALGDPEGHANDDGEGREWLIDRERWLTDTLRKIDRMGAPTRRAFNQLCIDINPDCGPKWLDSLIWHWRRRPTDRPVELHEVVPAIDLAPLTMALKALAEIAGPRQRVDKLRAIR